eukprot:PITA_22815
MIFSFTSEDTIVGVLLQKNKDGHEQPIAFMSRALQNSELKYNTMEKQAYALVKSLKHFKTYVGYSKIIAIVPHSAVKNILTQTDFLGTRARWVTKIQEYDLEIRPTKLVKDQGLAQMLTEGNEKTLGLFCLSDLSLPELQRLGEHEWYKDIVYYLMNLACPNHLAAHKRRALRLKATKYCLMKDGLGWRNPESIVLRNCQACQLFTGKQKLAALPLQPVIVEAPFQHWGLDFIEKFHENSNNGYSWILTATDYFTKWVEAIPAKNATENVIMDFIENIIITRFGVPAKITIDNAKDFSSSEFSFFCFKYGIVLSHSSNYYPQGNGLAESSNKNLITIIKKIVGDNKRSWDSKIKYALWADRITKKKATSKSPFELVYGLDVTVPVHLKLPAY